MCAASINMNVNLQCPLWNTVPFSATFVFLWKPDGKATTNPHSCSFIIYVKAMSWTSRTGLQRAGGLILLDKQPLSSPFSEWGRKTTRDRCKSCFKDLQNPTFYTYTLSLLVIIVFALPLFPSEESGKKRKGMAYLTLICPVVNFRVMTCYLWGKGQLFLSTLSESQFTGLRDFFQSYGVFEGLQHFFSFFYINSWIFFPVQCHQ